MLFGHDIDIYTDHINLTRDTLGMTSVWVYRWWLLIEEYGPHTMYIKGINNTVADAVIGLDYNPALNRHVYDKEEKLCKETKWNNFLTVINRYNTKSSNEMNTDYK